MPAPATTADIAAEKGLPRIEKSNAAQFNPPGLRGLQGRTNQAKRNAPDSAPSLWYWQMTGMNWLDTKPPCSGPKYSAAQLKHSRLLEEPEQHQEQLSERRKRDRARAEQDAAEREKQQEQAEQEAVQRDSDHRRRLQHEHASIRRGGKESHRQRQQWVG